MRKRFEHVSLAFDVYTPTRSLRIEDQLAFRTYTARQMANLLSSVDSFEVIATYDFAYDLELPVNVDSATEDVVYILRKR